MVLVVAMIVPAMHMEDPSVSIHKFLRAVTVATLAWMVLDSTGLALLWLRWLAGLIGLQSLCYESYDNGYTEYMVA